MTEIQFYHLLTTPLQQALPKLMEKAQGAGMNSVILVASESAAKMLDDALWNADPNSFIPHGTMQDAAPEKQPVYITTRDENPNGAKVLVVTDGSQREDAGQYEKLLDIFDGHDPQAVAEARKRWKHYNDAGIKLNYIQQQKNGSWKSMAMAN